MIRLNAKVSVMRSLLNLLNLSVHPSVFLSALFLDPLISVCGISLYIYTRLGDSPRDFDQKRVSRRDYAKYAARFADKIIILKGLSRSERQTPRDKNEASRSFISSSCLYENLLAFCKFIYLFIFYFIPNHVLRFTTLFFILPENDFFFT